MQALLLIRYAVQFVVLMMIALMRCKLCHQVAFEDCDVVNDQQIVRRALLHLMHSLRLFSAVLESICPYSSGLAGLLSMLQIANLVNHLVLAALMVEECEMSSRMDSVRYPC